MVLLSHKGSTGSRQACGVEVTKAGGVCDLFGNSIYHNLQFIYQFKKPELIYKRL